MPLLEKPAFDKLVSDLIEHATYFETRWLLSGVAADCHQAAIELRNMRAKLSIYENNPQRVGGVNAATAKTS